MPSNTLQEKTELLQACDKLGCKWKTGVSVGLWGKPTSLDIMQFIMEIRNTTIYNQFTRHSELKLMLIWAVQKCYKTPFLPWCITPNIIFLLLISSMSKALPQSLIFILCPVIIYLLIAVHCCSSPMGGNISDCQDKLFQISHREREKISGHTN